MLPCKDCCSTSSNSREFQSLAIAKYLRKRRVKALGIDIRMVKSVFMASIVTEINGISSLDNVIDNITKEDDAGIGSDILGLSNLIKNLYHIKDTACCMMNSPPCMINQLIDIALSLIY